MKREHKGFIVKVNFWGDSITPMYKFRLYKPNKYWFDKLVWTEDLHRDEISGKLSDEFDNVIGNYYQMLKRWN